jgi:hypothetical protein
MQGLGVEIKFSDWAFGNKAEPFRLRFEVADLGFKLTLGPVLE